MVEIEWKGRCFELEKQAMHIAPGGSRAYLFEVDADNARILGDKVWDLREEFAFGMYSAKVIEGKFIVGFYVGLAEAESFEKDCGKDVLALLKQKEDVREGENRDGYRISSRDKVIMLLRT